MGNIHGDMKALIFGTIPDYLDIRDPHKRYLEQFLDDPNEDNAQSLFDYIHQVHRKEQIGQFMGDLRRYEDGFTSIIPEMKKHFCHSASVYALGLAMYNVCGPLRKALETARHPEGSVDQKPSFLFRWSLAACLHDVAYPLEMSVRSFDRYCSNIHTRQKDHSHWLNIIPEVYQDLNFLPVLNPANSIDLDRKDTGLGIVSFHLTNYRRTRVRVSFETLSRHLEQLIISNLRKGQIDHGVFSALIVLKRIHGLYQSKPGWDVKDFYYEVADASTAIFLHNMYRFSDLKDIFGDGKFRYDFPNPLGYLLFVADNLCEWSRKGQDEGSKFRLQAQKGRIVITISNEFRKTLKAPVDLIDKRPSIVIKWQDMCCAE